MLLTCPLSIFAILVAATSVGSAQSATVKRAATCPSYTLINARGTGEAQGESAGFRTMNSNVMSQLAGGSIYNVVYPAGYDQDSSAGTADIVREVESLVNSNPNTCIILQGYSQGASATVDALPKLTGKYMSAVKGVIFVGDPRHKANLACNRDNNGGTTTSSGTGIEPYDATIPTSWVSRTRDICIYGDGVCDTATGYGVTAQHLEYPTDAPTQDQGTTFIVAALS